MAVYVSHYLGTFASDVECERAYGWAVGYPGLDDPEVGKIPGLLYRNSVEDRLRYYDGTTWRSSDERLIDVTQFGAKGDGVTDDTVAVQAAINAAEGEWAVYFPRGSYLITSPLYLRTAAGAGLQRVTIKGDGPASIIVAALTGDADVSGGTVFYGADAVTDLVFEDFTIQPYSTARGYQRGFAFADGATRVRISRVAILNAGWDGAHTATVAGVWFTAISTDCLVEDCRITGLASGAGDSIGICFYTGSGSHERPIIRRNRIVGRAGLLPSGGIWCFNSHEPSIEENQITSIGSRAGFPDASGFGILVYGFAAGDSTAPRIARNRIETTNGTGIYVQNAARAIVHANHLLDTCRVQDGTSTLTGAICVNIGPGVISDNIIKTVGDGNVSLVLPSGISITSAPAAGAWPTAIAEGIRVIGNFVEDTAAIGIRLRGTVIGAVVQGNTVFDTPGGIGTAAGTDAPAGITIGGNTIIRQAVAPVDGGVGIILHNARNVAIVGNVISRAAGQGIVLDSGDYCTIQGNTIRDSGQTLANAYDGIDIGASPNIVVSGNSSWGVQQRYGITGTGTYITVVGNAFGGDTGGVNLPGPPIGAIIEHNQDVNLP